MTLQSKLKLWVALALTALGSGCGREDIRVYRVPKEKPPAPLAAASEDPHAGLGGMGRPSVPKVTFGPLPDNWKDVGASEMHVVNLSVTGKDDRHADVSAIPLPGAVGHDYDIANFWRDRLKLSALSAEELEKQNETVTVGDASAKLFEMVSSTALLDDKYKVRTLVAIFTRNGTIWSFNITGEDELVREQKKAFVDLLKTVKIDESAPAPAMAAASGMGGMSAGGNMAPPSGDRPQWQVPTQWHEQPASSMLLAKFVAGDASSGPADITVSVLGGTAGGALPNINRWRGQLSLGPISDAQLGSVATPLSDKLPGALLVDMSSDAPKPGQKGRTRLIAAMVPKPDQTWFYKLMGDETAVAREKDAFIKFVQTVQYPNGR